MAKDECEKMATLQEHQNALYVVLEEFDRVCKKLDIPYVIFAGTLLGAVRHQGFIPWDDDVDVMMLREDYDRFLREADQVLDAEKFFLQKEFSEHWPLFFSKLRLNNTTCLEKFHPRDHMMHQGIYIDIFPCDNAWSSAFGRKLQFLASKVVISKSLDKRGYDTDSIKKKLIIWVCRLLPMTPFLSFVKGGNKRGETVHSFFSAALRKLIGRVAPELKYSRCKLRRLWISLSVTADHSNRIFYSKMLQAFLQP